MFKLGTLNFVRDVMKGAVSSVVDVTLDPYMYKIRILHFEHDC